MTYTPALRQHEVRGIFPYHRMQELVDETTAIGNRERLYELFLVRARAWDSTLNTEWLIREYHALKAIMASSVMLASERFADQSALRAAQPYLIYYGLFHAARAFVLTLPTQEWRDGALLTLSHKRVANIVVDEVRFYGSSVSDAVRSTLEAARTHRELFSYSFPAEGPGSVDQPEPISGDDAVSMATFLCELAQLNSEALDAALEKHSAAGKGYLLDELRRVAEHTAVDGTKIGDREDWYRIDQLKRHFDRPSNLWMLVREGMVDDFFPPWGGEEDVHFDVDEAVRLLFPFP